MVPALAKGIYEITEADVNWDKNSGFRHDSRDRTHEVFGKCVLEVAVFVTFSVCL